MRNFHFSRRAGPPAGGFSLVELMVALALGLIILAALLESFSSHSSASSTNSRFAEVQTNGRYAIDALRREVQADGYFGYTFYDTKDAHPPNIFKLNSTDTADYGGCGPGFAARIEQPVWGSNDNKGLDCIAAEDYAGGDVLVLRRASVTPFTGSPVANTLYLRTQFDRAMVFVGPTAPPVTQPPSQDFTLRTDVYWVRPYTNSTTESPRVPALMRKSLTAGSSAPTMTDQVLASGIENMQVQFGVMDGAGNVAYNNADPGLAWQNVVALRLWVLARSSDAEYGGFTNTTAYDLGGQTVTVNDHYQRQIFPLVAQIRR